MAGDEGGAPDGGGSATVDAAKYEALQERFNRTVEAKKGLETQLGELKNENQQLAEQASGYQTLAQELAESKKEAERARGQFERWKTTSGLIGSTDPDVIEAFEWRYNKLDGDDVPAFDAWVEGLKQDPSSAPKVLRQFLPDVEGEEGAGDAGDDTGADAGAGGGAKQRPKHVPRAGHENPAEAPAKRTKEELRRIREEAERTGDWGAWEKVRETL